MACRAQKHKTRAWQDSCRLKRTNPDRRKDNGKARPLASLAFNKEFGPVPLGDVLHYGQAQPRSASLA